MRTTAFSRYNTNEGVSEAWLENKYRKLLWTRAKIWFIVKCVCWYNIPEYSFTSAYNINIHHDDHIDSGNLHSCIYHLVFILMTTSTTESHWNNTMTFCTLEMLDSIILLLVNWLQFTLTHTAKSDLFMAITTYNAPISTCKSLPFFGMTKFCHTSIVSRTIHFWIHTIEWKLIITLRRS